MVFVWPYCNVFVWVALGAGDCGGPQLPGERRINPDYHLTTCVNQNLCPAFFASCHWQKCRNVAKVAILFMIMILGLSDHCANLILTQISMNQDVKGALHQDSTKTWDHFIFFPLEMRDVEVLDCNKQSGCLVKRSLLGDRHSQKWCKNGKKSAPRENQSMHCWMRAIKEEAGL